MSPYIITTNEPFDAAEHVHRPAFSRRAVATLDEAWFKLPAGIPDTTLARERFALEEHGRCTVGPLPDGTVIDVERVSGYALAQRGGAFGLDPSLSDSDKLARIIDHYNATQN